MIDPLRFAIAGAPLAAYLLLLGLINLRGKPLVVSGAGDLATLGLALSGVAFVGPIALFRPEAATAELGDYVWLFLLAFYWLWLTLIVMLCRPRIVIYNTTPEQLRPALSEAIRKLDPDARWARDAVALPNIGVQAHLDLAAWSRNTSLVASGGRQAPDGWRRLSRAVERATRGVGARPNRAGHLLLTLGVTLLSGTILALANDPQAVAVAWAEVFAFGPM